MFRPKLRQVAVWMFVCTLALPAAAPTPVAAQTYRVVVEKRCLACGREVPLTSQVGQRCPHCGAFWGRQVESEKRETLRVPAQPRPRKKEAAPPRAKTPQRPRTLTQQPQRRVRPATPPAVQTDARTQAWKQSVLSQAAAINPRVREVLGGVPAPVEAPPAPAPAEAAQDKDTVRDAEVLLRSSRGAPVRARQLALWIVRHPHASRADIPAAYGSGRKRADLLREARLLIVKAGLNPQRYRAFRSP